MKPSLQVARVAFMRGEPSEKWKTEPTPRQLEILTFIADYTTFHKYPPTFREIGLAHGISGTNCVMGFVTALERKGLLTRAMGRSRTMTLTKAGHAALSEGPSLVLSCDNPPRDPQPAADARCAEGQAE